MSTITTDDGTEISYKEWDSGQSLVFSHGWPVNADAGKTRCSTWRPVAIEASHTIVVTMADRANPGTATRSTPSADDLSELIETLDLIGIALVGQSTGGGEVSRYVGYHGNKRIGKALLMGAVTPLNATATRRKRT
jgi:non-heme chloroperoxidase